MNYSYCADFLQKILLLILLEIQRSFEVPVFNVTVGQLRYPFEVVDNGNFTVRIDGEQPEGSTLVDNGGGQYTFQWTPTRAIRNSPSFVAVDNLDATSLFSPLLHVCTCFNGGECTSEGVTRTNGIVLNLTCVCTEGIIKL